jgi:hypothetical protein
MTKIETKLNSESHLDDMSQDYRSIEFFENLFRQKLIYYSFLVTSSKYLELPYPLKGKNSSN